MLRLLAVLSLGTICFSTGCSSTNISKLTEALGKDNATVVSKVSSIYGTGYVIRSNPGTNQDVTITSDGTVTIKSH